MGCQKATLKAIQTIEEVADDLREFLEEHFQRTTDPTIYIHYTDFLDFIFERTDFGIQKVKRVLLLWDDLEIHNGRVYGLQCITDVDINMEEELEATSSSDDALTDSEEDF